MKETLAIRFTSDERAVRRSLNENESIDVTTISQLPSRPRRLARMRMYDRLALVGSPPRDGIGYGFTPVIAAMLRPRTVMTVDIESRRRNGYGRNGYVIRNAVPGILQIAVSTAAACLQFALAEAARRVRPERRRHPSLTRVLYLRPLVGMATSVGGSVTHAHGVIRGLSEIGVSVVPVTTDEEISRTSLLDSDAPRWNVLRVPWLLRGLPASFALGGDAVLLAGALCHRRDICAIYQRHTRFSLAGALASHVLRRPLFLEFNSPSDFFRTGRVQPMARLRALCERASLASATRVIVVSEVAKRQLCDLGIPSERIVVNPNGVESRRFAGGGGPAVRTQRGVENQDVLFGFVGSFGPWHGAPVLGRAFVELARELCNVRLLLVGDGEELAEVRNSIGDLIESGRVIVEGSVDPSQVPAFLDACDVLVSPHVPLAGDIEFFGSPTKLFEYMAAGKAIVASRLGQIGDVLEDERSALLVEPGDQDALVAAMRRLASDCSLRARLGAAARSDAEQFHGWRRNAERIVAAFGTIPSA